MFIKKEIFEPRFQAVPPKPLHPVFTVVSGIAAVTILSALCSLDYKNHMFIDIFVGLWVITMYFFDLVAYNFLNIIVAAIFLVISLAFEAIWYSIYIKVSS